MATKKAIKRSKVQSKKKAEPHKRKIKTNSLDNMLSKLTPTKTAAITSSPPLSIKTICIYNWAVQGSLAVIALIMIFLTNVIISVLTMIAAGSAGTDAEKALVSIIGSLTHGFGTAIGITLLVFIGIFSWLTYQLWLGKNWARIVQTVFSALGLFNFPGILINGLIIYFLWVDEKTKTYFNK